MSAVDALRRYADRGGFETDASDARERVVGAVFGDEVGLAVFLASCCLFGLVWRTGFLINDSYTLANGLYALERGSVSLTEAAYGPSLRTPGVNALDGEIYARNYGMLVAALPVLYALDLLDAVADLRIALVAAWCLALLAFGLVLGRLAGRERLATVGGSAAVLGVFALNAAIARPLVSPGNHLLALQIVHAVAAAFVGVFTYRLVGVTGDRRLGALAAGLVTLGTPLAFWATVPKRHVVTAAVVVTVAFAVARSRAPADDATRFRATAYALVGFLAWVHAPEALLLWCGLVAVDLPTAPSNDPRTLAVVAGAFLLSLVPFFATNALISGDPLLAPRMLGTVGQSADPSLFDAGGTGGGGGTGGSGGEEADWRPPAVLVPAVALVESASEPLVRIASLVAGGVTAFVRDPTAVYHAFVRSGYVERLADRAADTPAANLSLLESAPVLGGLTALVPATIRAARRNEPFDRVASRVRPVDAFVALLFVGYSLLYVSRLPLHAQVTVRYLFPLYPLGVYGLVRLPPVRRCLTRHWHAAVWTYAGGVLVGGQLLVAILVALEAGRGEAFQLHALLGLTVAASVAVWGLIGRLDRRPELSRRADRWTGRLGAVAIGLATASATVFVLLAALEYFPIDGSHALPVMRALADAITVL